uniref:GAF domain-containing protein n=1 Tax=Bodo saltans TaxID=75058 RepID=B6DTA4_BODSA|nr:hypothetical protein [Bodo saltans]
MERTHPSEYVYQLPRRNRGEVEHRDEVEDKQSLLNETWSTYASRQGYPSDRVYEEHSKWATETWAEFEERIVVRASNLDGYFKHQRALAAREVADREQSAVHSSNLVQSLMERENAIRNAKIASIHTLFVDFEERQKEKMRAERAVEENEEATYRDSLYSVEFEERSALEERFSSELQAVIDHLEARRKAQEEEERRLLEEQRRKADELRQMEEQKKRDAEAADKARREAEEEAKRAERKRREEERKNKAKAEREARAKQTRSETSADAPESETKPLPSPRLEKPDEVAATPAAPVPTVDVPIFAAVTGDSVSALLSSATLSLSVSGWSAFAVMVQGEQRSLVVAQSGASMGTSAAAALPNVGKLLSPGFTPLKLSRAGPAASLDEFVNDFAETISAPATDSRCTSFVEQTGSWTSLIVLPATPVVTDLTPVPMEGDTHTLIVVATPNDDALLLHAEVVRAIAKHVATQLTPRLLQLLQVQRSKLLGQQALEWLSITTACKNCAFALSDNSKAPVSLTFVSATTSQQFVVGTTFTVEEETASAVGVSFALIQESIKTGQPEVAHISDIQDKSTNKVNGNAVRFFGEPKSGSLLLCPVMRPAHPGTGEVFGVLYIDTIGMDDKAFNKADEDIIRTTAVLLADLLTFKRDGDSASQVHSVKLALERDLFGDAPAIDSPILFLKHIWLKVNTDISQISANQLQELASYNHPPPIIPTTVSATLLVALGTNPKNLESWDDIRKRVKSSLVEKIINFDPSDPSKRKKAFYTRARKVTKGLSAHDVFTRGSYPASCFFTWTFVTILIRKTSDELRALYQGSAALTPLALVASPASADAPQQPDEEDETTIDDGKEDDAEL